MSNVTFVVVAHKSIELVTNLPNKLWLPLYQSYGFTGPFSWRDPH